MANLLTPGIIVRLWAAGVKGKSHWGCRKGLETSQGSPKQTKLLY